MRGNFKHRRNFHPRGGRKRQFGGNRNFNQNKRRKFDRNEEKSPEIEEKAEVASQVVSDYESSDSEPEKESALSRLLATFSHSEESESEDEEQEEEEEEVDEEQQSDSDVMEHEDEGEEASSDEDVSDDDNEDLTDNEEHEESCSEEEDNEDDDEEHDDNDDDELSSTDIFKKHFENNLTDNLADQIKETSNWTSSFLSWNSLGRLKMEVPNITTNKTKPSLLLSEEGDPPEIGLQPTPPDSKFTLETCNIKPQIIKNFPIANVAAQSEDDPSMSEEQKEILSILNTYSDFYYPTVGYRKWDLIRPVYCLHAVNHILKTRQRVLHHNAKINKAKKEKKFEESDVFRDQGYCRPKVLILLPFRHSAYKVVHTIMDILFPNKGDAVQNSKRFDEDFGPGSEDNKRPSSKPDDFQETFKGDIREDFKLGISITKKSLKLYTEFSQSDIIIASPLGLRVTIYGEDNKASSDADFLSSIEVLILDQADVFMMQNWEHVMIIMEMMNQSPHNLQKLKTDIFRVRMWSLDGHSSLYRQTIVFADTIVDNHRALVRDCKNFSGKVQVLNIVKNGTIRKVLADSEFIFMKISGNCDRDARFKYFVDKVLPQFRSNNKKGTLLYIPDYCDYLRVVKYLTEDGGASLATINEYMVGENAKVAKARSNFFDGKKQFMMYTERFHFYRRYIIKGIRHIIFYSPPTYPHFFSELCNFMLDGNQNIKKLDKIGYHSVTTLYQKSDLSRLVGILGSEQASDIVQSNKQIHLIERR